MSFLQTNVSEKASVQVAVRVRPLNHREDGTESIVETKGNSIYIRDPETNKNKTFNYDYAYPEESTQEEIHNDIGTYVINSAFKGYNTCVFAYGQTGCFAKGTTVMLYSGKYKNIEDVEVDDILMGDDSTPRNVLKLFRGTQDMYKISSNQSGHTGYTVNADHILLFKIHPHINCQWVNTCNHWIVDWFDANTEELKTQSFIPVSLSDENIEIARREAKDFADNLDQTIYILEKSTEEYFAMSKYKKKYYSLYTSGVEFPERQILLDPYFLGLWLGDGGKHNCSVTNTDPEIVEAVTNYCKIGGKENPIVDYHNLLYNKHIPDDFKYNSRNIRLRVLAGIIDTNGSYNQNNGNYEITQKSKILSDDITYLSRSLGFYTSVQPCFYKEGEKEGDYWRIYISGDNLDDIPVLLPRKKVIKSTCTHTFLPNIECIGPGKYYGFLLDGNHRFIGADFNVLRNSGKSHAMTGSDDKPGLIPRVCQALFERQTTHNGLDVRNANVNYKLEVSYLEIYSENVRDLLSRTPTASLRVREHPEFGPYVEGLRQVLVEDYVTIKKLIDQGNKERVTASTLMNNRSSRSHAIMTLYFTQLIDEPDIGKTREVVSKINLVDLAGSERVEMSGVTGINFKEAININTSLSTLGLVISKLAAQSQARLMGKDKSIASKPTPVTATTKPTRLMTGRPTPAAVQKSNVISPTQKTSPKSPIDKSISEHVPYRDSVLTWILKESLGGNSKTFMIATVSPSELNYNESLSTLRYAANAKQIVNTVKINEDPNDKLIRVLKDEIETLRRQLITRGSDSTSSAEDLKALKDEISQREELIREKDKSWEQKLEESKRINNQVQEQLKKELSQKQAEFRQKLELMNSEREQMLREMESMKSGMTSTDLKQQRDLEEEFQKKQAEFEKDRIVGTAVSLQEYYEKKLEKMKEDYELRSKEYHANENSKALKDISDLKDANIKLKEELNRNQRDLQQQIRQFTTDRLVLSKQIQQLHNKIHTLEQEQSNAPVVISQDTNEAIKQEYEKVTQLRDEEEKKYHSLQTECKHLDARINHNKQQLTEIEQKHNTLLKEVEVKTADLLTLKSEYAQLVEKFTIDKIEYDALITKKERLHTEIVSLKCNLDLQVESAREKLKNPTIEDLLRIKEGLTKIFESIQKS